MKITHALLFVLCATVALSQNPAWPTFENYCLQFNKNYAADQLAFRKQIYESRRDSLQGDATSGATSFSDWTDEELAAFLPPTFNPEQVPDQLPENSDLRVSATTSIDWRNSGRVSDIRNQGTCGACWSFSTTAAVESYFLQKGTKYDLSEEYLVECTTNSTCAGGYVNEAMTLFINTGMPLETQYPYLGSTFGAVGRPSSGSGICDNTANYNKGSAKLKFNYYTNITDRQYKVQLSDSPFVSLIYADTGFMNYKNGTYGCATVATQANLNHAVLVIGYNENGDYLIKNSWGTGWGMSGFGIVNASNDCGMKIATYQLSWAFRSMGSLVGLVLMALLALFA